jgi:hypothetical protein
MGVEPVRSLVGRHLDFLDAAMSAECDATQLQRQTRGDFSRSIWGDQIMTGPASSRWGSS